MRAIGRNLFGRAAGTSSGPGNTFLCCAEVHGRLGGVSGQPELCSDSVRGRVGGGGGGFNSDFAGIALAWACCHSAADISASIGLPPQPRCCCCCCCACSMRESTSESCDIMAAGDREPVARSTSLQGRGFETATFSSSCCDAAFSCVVNRACAGLVGGARKVDGFHTGRARAGAPTFVGMPSARGGDESIPSSLDTKLVYGPSSGVASSIAIGLGHCTSASGVGVASTTGVGEKCSSSNLGRLEATSDTCGTSGGASGTSVGG